MNTTEIIQLAVTILSSTTIVLILGHQIKSQQGQINAMKSNMESMKSFIDIFKVDEVKKYVDLTSESHRIKAETDAVQKVYKEVIPELIKTRDVGLSNQNKELFSNTCDFLFKLYDEERLKKILNERYPTCGDSILNAFNYAKTHPTNK